MNRHQNKSILSILDHNKFFILIGFAVLAVIVAGEHFWSTLRFFWQWFQSLLIGASETFPNPYYRTEALLFFAKTATAFLVGLSALIAFGVFFAPALGFSQIIDKLADEKNMRIKTLREFGDHLEKFNAFVSRAEQHQRAQLALMSKYDSIVEELNLNTLNAQRAIHDLNLRIDQLRAISAALGNELDGPKRLKGDQGDF